MTTAALTLNDEIRFQLDLAYGPDPHNEKVATKIIALTATALTDETVVQAAAAGIPTEMTPHGIHARCAVRDVLKIAIEQTNSQTPTRPV
jgi:hypothetical protein